ncbi:MAG: hypothetical protein AAGD86_02135 [Pseudomonadota bacterium]
MQRGKTHWLFIAVVGGLALLALALFVPGAAPTPTAEASSADTLSPAASAARRGDTAREVVAAMEASGIAIDYENAFARAREFHASGRLADAEQLYVFAARGGSADAALTLAGLYDPLHQGETAAPLGEPDLLEAFRWYTRAGDAGAAAAAERLAALRAWAEQAAGTGDADATELLEQWR